MYLARHNHLEAPYDNYAQLSLCQLDDLATDQISPDIQLINNDMIQERFSFVLGSVNEVYASPAKRTIQTGQAVLKACSSHRDLKIEALFKEIYFSPILLLEDHNSKSPLQDIREGLYSAIYKRKAGVENYKDLKSRIEKITETFLNKNVLCFSHGFLIRLLVSYHKNNYNFDDALNNIDDIVPVDYLELIKLPV